jgi:TIR domain
MSSVKLFVSFAERDGGDFAQAIFEHYTDIGIEVFVSRHSIDAVENYEDKIYNSISNCTIFIILVTPTALTNSWMEKELSAARKLEKRIIPCVFHRINRNDGEKWGINKMHLIKFYSKHSLIRELAWATHIWICPR